jgi:hypothetical protein
MRPLHLDGASGSGRAYSKQEGVVQASFRARMPRFRAMVGRLALVAVLALPVAAGPAIADNGGGGDIPDNQVFLSFHDGAGGYTIKYPEGWARRGSGALVTFTDKDNSVRIAVSHGRLPTAATVRAQLPAAKITGAPARLVLPGGPALKVVYQRRSAPDPVTGKRLTLTIDRYYVAGHQDVAVIDLATPVGVDNVDAYRLISRSFRWQR